MSKNRIVVMGLQNWHGTPRLPRALRAAGFEVAVICLAGDLLSRTRFAHRRFETHQQMKLKEILGALWHYVVEWGASSVIAADDKSLEVLHEFAAAAETGQLDAQPGKDVFLQMLAQSLPPAPMRAALRSKSAAQAIARDCGIAAPAQQPATTLDAALQFAATEGYPLVLKPDRGSSGLGVAICGNAEELKESFPKLSGLARSVKGNRLLLEAFVPGVQLSYPFVALDGRLLAGLTRQKIEAWPTAQGPSSVVEIVDRPDIAEAARRFAEASRYTGFASIQFLFDAATQRSRFLEFNARPVPMMHMDASLVGIDWCKTWHAAMAGATLPPPGTLAFGRRIALFPQEWLRDPNSAYLKTEAIADVPWDDPELLAGYLQLAASAPRQSAEPMPVDATLH